MLEKRNTDMKERKKPYLDRIHSHEKVKKIYIVNEILGFVEWILWTLLFVMLLSELNGIESSFGVSDITYLYVYMMQSRTGFIIIGILAVIIFGYKIFRSSMSRKLEALEDEVYAQIVLADGVSDIVGQDGFAEPGDESAEGDAQGGASAPKTEEAPKKFVLFKVINALKAVASIAMIGILFYSVWSYLPFGKSGSAGANTDREEILVELDAPTGLSYDPGTHTLSWNSTDGAVSYQVEHNGMVYDVVGNSTPILISQLENSFRVKAVASTETLAHRDSDWSWPLMCQLDRASLPLYDRINLKLGEVAAEKNYKLMDVIGISQLDPNPAKRVNIAFDTLCMVNREVKYISFWFSCYGATTAAEIMSRFDTAVLCNTVSSPIVSYNSAQVYLDSLAYDETYDGGMRAFIDAGYSIAPIKSAVLKGHEDGKRFRFYFAVTYVATKGNDVQCFSAYYRVLTDSKSSDDKNNYETFLTSRDYSTVREEYSAFHGRGGTGDYMYELIRPYIQSK